MCDVWCGMSSTSVLPPPIPPWSKHTRANLSAGSSPRFQQCHWGSLHPMRAVQLDRCLVLQLAKDWSYFFSTRSSTHQPSYSELNTSRNTAHHRLLAGWPTSNQVMCWHSLWRRAMVGTEYRSPSSWTSLGCETAGMSKEDSNVLWRFLCILAEWPNASICNDKDSEGSLFCVWRWALV